MALCEIEQSGWAVNILSSLDDTTTATGSVVSWLRNNLWQLNLSLNTGYYLSGSCVEPEMSQNVSGIYVEIYYCYYYAKQVNKLLNASSYDWVEIEGTDQGRIRKVSKNETAKTFMQLSKQCKESLALLIEWYNGGQNPVLATQVLFGNRYGGSNYDLLPPCSFYSSSNFIWS